MIVVDRMRGVKMLLGRSLRCSVSRSSYELALTSRRGNCRRAVSDSPLSIYFHACAYTLSDRLVEEFKGSQLKINQEVADGTWCD